MSLRHAAALLAAACLAGGCGGGSGGAASAKPTKTTRPSASPRIESPAVRKMPAVPADSARRAPAGKVHEPARLHAAFASAEAMWDHEFSAAGLRYRNARLTFFDAKVDTACGLQSSETGPFYCPASYGVYLNTDFFDALARKFGLTSASAADYITAHEVGHHVQQLLGVHHRVAIANQASPGGANARSVRVELQADCYAGIWLHAVSRRGELGEADVRDILRAATVVGDDFQRNLAGAELAPETWTHGSSAQRVHWVSVGLEQGSPAACDTFGSG